MKNIFDTFLFTISYFSILPIFKKNLNLEDKNFKYIFLFFPIVGIILALLTIGLHKLLTLYFINIYASFICSVFYLLLYGFIHLEAICDVVDGYFAKHSGKDALKIMKESTIGAIGAIYTFCFILLKIAILTYLLYEHKYTAIFLVLLFSRLNLIFLIDSFRFEENSFLFKASKNLAKLKIFSFIYILGALVFYSYSLYIFILSLFLFFIILKTLHKHFSFVNGDCLGFTLEHTELLLLNLLFVVI